MKIKLHEIPEEGREYILNRKTGELNTVLQDLIANSEYAATVFIRPMNTKNYEITGSVATSTQEVCSICGEDFKFSINAKLHEILLPKSEDYKNSQISKSNHFSELDENGPGVSEYSNDVFELGEYIHEAIALCIPFNPKHEAGDKACVAQFKQNTDEPFIYDEKTGEEKKNTAFSALKGIKFN